MAEKRGNDFSGLSVVVVGGGAGLGRQYCLDLGIQGAQVTVVGRGAAAAEVAEEIVAGGGIATAVIADAREGERIIDAAIVAYGTIDALIVNAGIVQDSSFAKMSKDAWAEVLSVHVDGSFACAKAAWGPMREKSAGHILLTTSGAGMHGNFGQANYAAAKGAIIGLTRSLAVEGASRNIRVNAIAPMARTSMTEAIFDPALRAGLRPEDVSPVALALVHPSFTETGVVVETGGGWVSKMRWERSQGVRFTDIDMGQVLAYWTEIARFDEAADYPTTTADSLGAAMDQSRGTRR